MKKGQKKSTTYKLVELRCKQCGLLVERFNCRAKQFKYCSSECREKARRLRTSHKKIELVDKILCICKNQYCKKEVKVNPYRSKMFRYCSPTCKAYSMTKEYKERIKNDEFLLHSTTSEKLVKRQEELLKDSISRDNDGSQDINSNIVSFRDEENKEVIFNKEEGMFDSLESDKKIKPIHVSIWGLNKKKRNSDFD